MMSLNLTTITSISLLFLYFGVNFYTAEKLSGTFVRGRRLCFVIASIFNTAFVSICIYFSFNIPLIYFFIFLLLFIDFYAFFHVKHSIILWGAVNSTALFIGLRGFITSFIALVVQSNLYTVMTLNDDRLLTLNITLVILNTTIFCLTKIKMFRHSVLQIFNNRKQLYFVDTMVTIMTLYLLFCTDMFFYAVEFTWFTSMHLICNLATIAGVYLVYRYAVRATIWEQNTMEVKTTQKLLERQIFHYQAYTQYAESIRRFRHDYTKVTSSIKSLLRAGEGERALQILEEMDHTLQTDIAIHRQFSTNIAVDAALHELADESLSLTAEFDANVMLPSWPELSDIKVTQLFTAISHVLAKYCATTPAQFKRKIRVYGEGSDSWFTLICHTTFGGIYSVQETDIPSRDPFTLNFNDIKSIVDDVGGFINTELDTVTHVIKMSINISKATSKGGEK